MTGGSKTVKNPHTLPQNMVKYPSVSNEAVATLIRRLDAARNMVYGQKHGTNIDQLTSVARSIAVVEKRFAPFPRQDVGLHLPLPTSDGSVAATIAVKTVQTIETLASKAIGMDRGAPVPGFAEAVAGSSEDLFLFSAYVDPAVVDITRNEDLAGALSAVDDLGTLLAGMEAQQASPKPQLVAQRPQGSILGGVRRAGAAAKNPAGRRVVPPPPPFQAPVVAPQAAYNQYGYVPQQQPYSPHQHNQKMLMQHQLLQQQQQMYQDPRMPQQQYKEQQHLQQPVLQPLIQHQQRQKEVLHQLLQQGPPSTTPLAQQHPIQHQHEVQDSQVRSRAGANTAGPPVLSKPPIGLNIDAYKQDLHEKKPQLDTVSLMVESYVTSGHMVSKIRDTSDLWKSWRIMCRLPRSKHSHIEFLGPTHDSDLLTRLNRLDAAQCWSKTHGKEYDVDWESSNKLESEYEDLQETREDLQQYLHNIQHFCKLLEEDVLDDMSPMKREGKSYKVRKEALELWHRELSNGVRQVLDDRRSHAQFPLLADLRDAYGRMLGVLRVHPHCLSSVLPAALPTDADNVVRAAEAMFSSSPNHPTEQASYLRFIEAVLAEQFTLCNEPKDFLRTDSHVTKLLVAYTRRSACRNHLRLVLSDLISTWISNVESLELDPAKIGDSGTIEEHAVSLARTCDDVLHKIMTSLPVMPYGLRWLCKAMVILAKNHFSSFSIHQERQMVGAFVFLRYFGPAIFSPAALDIIPETTVVPPVLRRNFVLIAKMLQALVNDLTFGGKEEYMTPMKVWVQSRKPLAAMYIDALTDVVEPEELIHVSASANDVRSKIVTLPINEIFALHRTLERLRLKEKEKEDALRGADIMAASGGTVARESWSRCRRIAGPKISRLLQELGDGPVNVPRNQNRPYVLEAITGSDRAAGYNPNLAVSFCRVGDPSLTLFCDFVSAIVPLLRKSDAVGPLIESTIAALPDSDHKMFWILAIRGVGSLDGRCKELGVVLTAAEHAFDAKQSYHLQISEERSSLVEATAKINTDINQLREKYQDMIVKLHDLQRQHAASSTSPTSVGNAIVKYPYPIRKVAIRDVVLRGPMSAAKSEFVSKAYDKHLITVALTAADVRFGFILHAPDTVDRQVSLDVAELLEMLVKNDTLLLCGYTFDLRRLIAFLMLHAHKKS